MSDKMCAFLYLKDRLKSSKEPYDLKRLTDFYDELVKQCNSLTELDFLRKAVWGDKRFVKIRITTKLMQMKWKRATRLTEDTYDFLRLFFHRYQSMPMIVEDIHIDEYNDERLNSIHNPLVREDAVIVEPRYHSSDFMMIKHGFITKMHLGKVNTLPNYLDKLAPNLQLLSLPNVPYAPQHLQDIYRPIGIIDLHLGYKLNSDEIKLFSKIENIHYFQTYSEWRYRD